MNTLQAEAYCLSLPGATEDMPFGDDVVTFRVANKIFAFMFLGHQPQRLALKCDPERAIQLRAKYDAIEAAYHLNKKHWNQLEIANLPSKLIEDLIVHSYNLVLDKLPKIIRNEILSNKDQDA
ncbi:MmcQ/YjbR family DNA-binding protein [Falsiporphyromonas endometrii]|uniref:MmcQ/YjbR family DNA-binding protein n=1 Tax=Falsiporphyromonas endometrii TaxID=1387297 RepID=A0ABV9K8X3_9PORP